MSAATVASTKRRVLVVDDEDNVTHLVSSALRFDGFETTTADSGTAALAKVAETDPDLIVLDVMMPGPGRARGAAEPARGAAPRCRSSSSPPATPRATASSGCAPAPTTTWSSRSASRSCWPGCTPCCAARPPDAGREGVLKVADLELDENSHEVTRAGVEVHLTATEFELLRYLMRNERVVLSKAQILDRVWKYDFQGQSNIVELYIGYLRKKVDNVEPKLIHTIRGAGYVVKAPRV